MLTISVYRVRPDGTRTRVLARTTVRSPARAPEPPPITLDFPPCRCPRCQGAG